MMPFGCGSVSELVMVATTILLLGAGMYELVDAGSWFNQRGSQS